MKSDFESGHPRHRLFRPPRSSTRTSQSCRSWMVRGQCILVTDPSAILPNLTALLRTAANSLLNWSSWLSSSRGDRKPVIFFLQRLRLENPAAVLVGAWARGNLRALGDGESCLPGHLPPSPSARPSGPSPLGLCWEPAGHTRAIFAEADSRLYLDSLLFLDAEDLFRLLSCR